MKEEESKVIRRQGVEPSPSAPVLTASERYVSNFPKKGDPGEQLGKEDTMVEQDEELDSMVEEEMLAHHLDEQEDMMEMEKECEECRGPGALCMLRHLNSKILATLLEGLMTISPPHAEDGVDAADDQHGGGYTDHTPEYQALVVEKVDNLELKNNHRNTHQNNRPDNRPDLPDNLRDNPPDNRPDICQNDSPSIHDNHHNNRPSIHDNHRATTDPRRPQPYLLSPKNTRGCQWQWVLKSPLPNPKNKTPQTSTSPLSRPKFSATPHPQSKNKKKIKDMIGFWKTLDH